MMISADTFDHDIALVKLDCTISGLTPITLPNRDDDLLVDSVVLAAGWGRTEGLPPLRSVVT